MDVCLQLGINQYFIMTTYETARDQFVAVGDITFAYRQLGRAQGIPLVLLMHFRFAYRLGQQLRYGC